jgi:N-dimethylarginine dimethylaminohydrolase
MEYERLRAEDIDALDGERWFPKESNFIDDLPLYWGDWGVASEVEELKACIMRRPGKEIEDFNYQDVRFFAPIDPERFRAQHDSLAQIYRDHGVKVYYVEEQREDRPNAIFCRDLLFMTPEGAIVTRPGMAARRGEERYMAQQLAKIGVPIIKTISGDGRFEGANAMWVDRETVILSTGGRTNRSGYEQVEHELRRMGVKDVIHMQIPYGHAHIDGLLNFASQDTAMIFAAQVPYDVCDALRKKGIRLIECPSRTEAKFTAAINYVAIKPGLVVQCEGNPRSKELLEKAGIKVISVDLSEILKGYGAMHCCTAFLKRG